MEVKEKPVKKVKCRDPNRYKTRLVTKIHNKYYDLTDFKHPGGPIALALADRRDATELFESHHLFTKKDLTDIMSAYEIDHEDEIKTIKVFDWEATKADPFTIELHEAAKRALGKNIKISYERAMEVAVLFLVAMTQMIAFGRGEWYSIFTLPLTFWCFAVNLFHDASHFALSTNWVINKLGVDLGFMFNTPYVWYHQHVIGHHSYPNILGMDPDLYHAPKIVRHSDDVRHKPQHNYQTFTFIFTWLVGVPMSLIMHGVTQALTRDSYNRVVKFGRNKYLNTDSLRLRQAVYFFFFHFMPFVINGLTFKGLLFAIIPIYLFSLFFMISTQINHLTPDTHEKFDKNFFKHQILTSHNVATDSYLVYIFTGGLNMQTEHHLFPSVNHGHLHKLQPVVRDLCKKYGVQYNNTPSLWEALCKHVAHLRKYATAPASKKEQ